jgi:hypothetical protein
MRVDATIAQFDETSRFLVEGSGLRPLSYRYSRKVLGKTREQQLSFDWQQHQATNRYKDKRKTLALSPGILDKTSYQLLLDRDLRAGLEPLDYQLIDKGKLEHHRFTRLGEERISTPAGDFDCIKVVRERDDNSGRQTYIWFAKQRNQVIVKLEQIESDGKRYAIHLERLDNP